MDRLKYAGELLSGLPAINSVLDVGCREGKLRTMLPYHIKYASNDLYQNSTGTVDYVGDISTLVIPQSFDAVVALDILEHVEYPSQLFDKLLSLADVALIISLPNCYDLKSRFKFACNGQLGGKYLFGNEISQDRHRWIMSRTEIIKFFIEKSIQHTIQQYSILDMKYGDPTGTPISRVRSIFRLLPSTLCAETVFGVFIK